MASPFEYFKVILDYLKVNKWLVMLVISGFLGTGIQTLEVMDKEAQKNTAIREVAAGFQAVQIEDKAPAPAVKNNKQCGYCIEEVKKLREEFH